MASHSSATVRESRTNTISNALRRRALSVVRDRSIDAQIRALVRYAMEIHDPCLPELVRRADAGESIVDADFSETQPNIEHELTAENVERLAEIICESGDESAAALLVLMGTLESCAYPKGLANTAKHLAFTRCGEINLHGIVDVQIETIKSDLLC